MYSMYPPWMSYPSQGFDPNGMSQKHFERGMQMATKLAQREAREKERIENRRKRDMEDARKRSRAAVGSFFTFIELYIIGVLTAPLAGEIYQRLVHH